MGNLASTGTLFTDPLTNGDTSFLTSPATTGDIQLQVGGSGGTTHDIAITQGSNDTINTLAAYINKQNWGVTASVVTDASGARLALYGPSSGTPGSVAVANNTTALTFNPPVVDQCIAHYRWCALQQCHQHHNWRDRRGYAESGERLAGTIVQLTVGPIRPRLRLPSTTSFPPTTR